MEWKLERFPECVDRWAEMESPSDDLRFIVLDWAIARHDDPYRRMRREGGHPNLWFGPVQGTETRKTVVTCSYFTFERVRVIRCNEIRTLNQPI